MKRILSFLLLLANLVWISGCGCDKVDFSYFKNKVNSIDNYKYYVVSEEIYNGELLLYKKDKNVYFDGDKSRIVVDVKEINEIYEEELYSESKKEFYKQGNNLYYKENGDWKVKFSENDNVKIGLSIEKSMFSSYKIDESSDTFSGVLKEDSISEFLGFSFDDISNMILNIRIGNNDKVDSVSLEYKENNGNNVLVSIKVGYEYISKFELPALN